MLYIILIYDKGDVYIYIYVLMKEEINDILTCQCINITVGQYQLLTDRQ